jgi:hypothetical protein
VFLLLVQVVGNLLVSVAANELNAKVWRKGISSVRSQAHMYLHVLFI